eukprot:13494730-Ditylum_brightwellii.AAC.1
MANGKSCCVDGSMTSCSAWSYEEYGAAGGTGPFFLVVRARIDQLVCCVAGGEVVATGTVLGDNICVGGSGDMKSGIGAISTT